MLAVTLSMLLAVRLPFHAVTRRLHIQPPVLAVLTLNAHRTSIRAAPANVLDEDLGPCARWGPGSESIADHKMGPVSTKLDPPQHCAQKNLHPINGKTKKRKKDTYTVFPHGIYHRTKLYT